MLTHSKRYAQRIEDAPSIGKAELIDNRSDAISYGRIAAKLGWSRDDFFLSIEPELVDIALNAHEKRMIELYGAPF